MAWKFDGLTMHVEKRALTVWAVWQCVWFFKKKLENKSLLTNSLCNFAGMYLNQGFGETLKNKI